jgi:hypothetical protein
MWELFGHAAWRVTLVSLVLGAGLPAIFALGIRETVLASVAGSNVADGRLDAGERTGTAWLHRTAGVVCFAVVVLAVVVGLAIIVASGLGKQVSFEHVYPTIVDKS